jgi:hypothetical protein
MLGAFVNSLVKALQSSLTRISNSERSVMKSLSLLFLIFVLAVVVRLQRISLNPPLCSLQTPKSSSKS